jgi:hypothetical protein
LMKIFSSFSRKSVSKRAKKKIVLRGLYGTLIALFIQIEHMSDSRTTGIGFGKFMYGINDRRKA